MHIEILVEDQSGKALLESLIPKLIGESGQTHFWRLHAYKGIGRIPKGLKSGQDAAGRILLDQLPRLLRGFRKTPSIDAVMVVLDSDRRNCVEFLQQLTQVANAVDAGDRTLFRLAIEEMEAWYFGDRDALTRAYPRAKAEILNRYVQDSVCGTWEILADAIYPGGSAAVKKAGWPLPGQVKFDWARKLGPLLDVDRNNSPSFCKLRDGLRRLVNSNA